MISRARPSRGTTNGSFAFTSAASQVSSAASPFQWAHVVSASCRFRVPQMLTDVRYPSSNLAQGPSNQADVEKLYRDCLKGLEDGLVQALHGRTADF